MVTTTATVKVMTVAKNRARKTALSTASEKFSQKFLYLPIIKDGPNITKIPITEGSRRDISMVTTEIDIDV